MLFDSLIILPNTSCSWQINEVAFAKEIKLLTTVCGSGTGITRVDADPQLQLVVARVEDCAQVEVGDLIAQVQRHECDLRRTTTTKSCDVTRTHIAEIPSQCHKRRFTLLVLSNSSVCCFHAKLNEGAQ